LQCKYQGFNNSVIILFKSWKNNEKDGKDEKRMKKMKNIKTMEMTGV